MKNIVFIFVCLLLSVPSQAEIIIVDDDWPFDFDNIQAAIDDSNDGDIIVVFPGTYTGVGNWYISFGGKAITVRSVAPQDPYIVAATIIEGNTAGSGFYFSSGVDGNSVIDGLTITNCLNGLRCRGGSSPTITNCTIRGCGAEFEGAGIICEASSPTFDNCTISGNMGGIICWDNSSVKISNCTITANMYTSRAYGGGICCSDSSITLTGCTIAANTGGADGGGIYCQNGNMTLTDCTITANTSRANGGGIYYGCDSATVTSCTITNCTITGNSAGESGGGMYYNEYYGGHIALTNSIIAANTAEYAGGIYLDASYTLTYTLRNCTITANTADVCGGISCDGQRYIDNCIIWGNRDAGDVLESAQIDWGGGFGWEASRIVFSCIQDDNPNDSYIPFGDPNHNIDDDPMFVREPDDGGDGWGDDPNTPGVDEGANDDFGDLHLQTSSPCINAGFLNFLRSVNNMDMDGQPRIIGGRVDIGADEVTPIIVVTKPQGDEVWIQNSSHEINWISYGIAGTVDISYSSNNGADWVTIENGVGDTGSYMWQLPDAIDSDECLVSIIPGIPDPNVACIESGVFTIKPDFIHPAVPSTWKSLGGDFDRTGLSENYGPELGCVKWQFETTARVTGSITIGASNRAHIACEDGKLYTLDSADGSLLWTYDANSPLLSSPTVGPDGSVYVGSKDGKLHVISIGGNLRWTHNTGGFIYSSPAVSDDGNVYVCSQDGLLYALGTDGSELWTFDTDSFTVSNGSVLASPTIGLDGAVYIAGLYDPNLYAIDANGESLEWTCHFDSNGWPFASPVAAPDGTIYQTLLYDSNLYAIEGGTGVIMWSTDLADPCSGWFDLDYADRYGNAGGWSEPVLGPEGTIYVALDDAHVRAVDPNGNINWVKRLGMTGGFTLTVGSDGLIYAAGDDGYLCVLDNTGAELARFQRDGDWLSLPVIAADNTIIISDSKDNTVMNEPANNVVWAIGGDDCPGQELVLHRPEDLNANRTVNFDDFALLAADWLCCSDENCNPIYNPVFTGYNYVDGRVYLTGDINRNLYVDFDDVETLANNWLNQE